MSILARYRKPGGFKQLLQLIETSQPVKQAKLLEVVAKEDPKWADLIKAKRINPEMVLSWKPEELAVIFEHMNPRHCACVFKNMGPDSIKSYATLFTGEKYRDLKSIVDEIDSPKESEVIAAHNNMLETVRYLDEEKKIDLRFIDPKLDLGDAA